MSLFSELRRRNVIRVAAAYLIAGWLLLQITDVLIGLLEWPAMVGKAVVMLLAVGFPIVVIFAWVFELTPDGLMRESDIQQEKSRTPQTGRRLNVVIIGLLALVAVYFFWESRFKQRAEEPASQAASLMATDTSETESVAEDKSVAVLPFVNMSADPENEYFADGLSEEILNRLAQVAELRVIGRTSSFAFKGQNRDLREIGSILNSATVLEGSVRRQGDTVRITAQLIATEDGAHLWSQTFDRQLEDVFATQDEIAQRVVDALGIVLDQAAREAMLAAGVRNVDAFVAYQRGLDIMINAHGRVDMFDMLFESVQVLDQAIEAAPDFAAAYVVKTDYYAHRVLELDSGHDERLQDLMAMQELWDKAFDSSRDPHMRLVIDVDRLFFSEDWSRLPSVLDALFRSDGCASGNWVELAIPFAPVDSMIKHLEHDIRCDPMNLISYMLLSSLHLKEQNLEIAQAIIDEGRRVGGDHRWLRAAEVSLKLDAGEAESVLADTEDNVVYQVPEQRFHARVVALAALGRIDEIRSLLAASTYDVFQSGHSQISLAAMTGNRTLANEVAARLDAQPGGQAELIRAINRCECGAPFDLQYTPRFAARLNEADWHWPPPALIRFPAKDW